MSLSLPSIGNAITTGASNVINALEGGVGDILQSKNRTKQNGQLSKDVSQIAQNLSPKGITNTLNKGANTPVLKELSGQEGPNAQAVAGMGMMGDADTAGASDLATGTKLMNQGIKGKPDLEPQPQTVNPQILDAKGNPTISTQAKNALDQPLPKTTTLNPNAETFDTPQKQTPPQNASSAWKDFSDQQKNYTPDPGQKAVRQLSPAQFTRENDPVGTVNSVHETLDRHGITNPSAEEQLSVLPAKRTQLYKEAQAQIQSDPDTAPVQTVMNNINSELASQTRLKDISQPAAQKALTSYNMNLYKEATGTPGNVVPNEIPYDTLLDMKTLSNQDYAKIQKKLDNNQPLTDTEKVNYAYRNGLDKTITARYPGVKQNTMDMSNLYKAQTPLAKAIPKYEAPKVGPSFLENAKNAALTLGGGAVAAKELGLNPLPAIQTGIGALEHGANQLYDTITNNKNSNQGQGVEGQNSQTSNNQNNIQNHGPSMTQFDTNVNSPADIPQTVTQIKQNPDGTYGVANIYSMKDSSGNPLFISPDQIKQQQLSIDQAKNTLLYKNSQAEQARVGSLQDQLTTQEQYSSQIQKPYTTTLTKNNAYSQAIKDAQSAGLDLGNYNGSYDDFVKQISPKYADLAAQLKVLESEGAINPNGDIKGATLTNALQTAAQGNLMQFYSTLSNVVGYTGQQTGGGAQTPQQAPQAANVPAAAPNIPKGFNIGGGTPQSLQLPSIQ